MKLRVLPDAHFSCSCCANCCRNWHVELSPDEVERVGKLPWPANDPLVGEKGVLRHSGKTYLAHAADHACVFLNRNTNLCRIHETFGEEAKPLGCRLYPFQIAPTFNGELTVTGRYDCPTVRKNEGAPHEQAIPELKQLASRMTLPAEFGPQAFTRDQIEAVCDFAGTLMNAFERDDQKALFLRYLSSWLDTIDPKQVDRGSLASSFGALKSQVESASKLTLAKPGRLQRFVFRTLLGLYLRRDEDVLDGRAGRVSRLLGMLAFVFGRAGFNQLGVLHPAGKLKKTKLFDPMPAVSFALHWRMIRSKLDSRQFMGSSNRGKTFQDGLRSLAILYPLVLAAAKYRARNRDASAIEESDIDYGVWVIEHSFGRGAVLGQSFALSLERFLLDPVLFTRLVRSM